MPYIQFQKQSCFLQDIKTAHFAAIKNGMGLNPLDRHRMNLPMGPNGLQLPPGMPFPFPPPFNAPAFMPYYPCSSQGAPGMPSNPAELFAMQSLMQQQLFRFVTQNAAAVSTPPPTQASVSPRSVNASTPIETTPTSAKKSPILKKGGFDVNNLLS